MPVRARDEFKVPTGRLVQGGIRTMTPPPSGGRPSASAWRSYLCGTERPARVRIRPDRSTSRSTWMPWTPPSPRACPTVSRAVSLCVTCWASPLEGPVVGGDGVEYNPGQDVDGHTAPVCAKLGTERAGQMVITAPDAGAADGKTRENPIEAVPKCDHLV
jgi:hypothetical protein